MSESNPLATGGDNVLPLRPRRRTRAAERAAQATNQVRRQLSLLQGYADLMEGLSPEQIMPILSVMAEKTRELTKTLHPFPGGTEVDMPALEDYRQARRRTRQLLADYRVLLNRLRTTVNDAVSEAES